MADADAANLHFCTMHPSVCKPESGKRPHHGTALLPAGTRFAMLRHMAQRPWAFAAMVVLMQLLMAAAMMLMR